MAVCTGGLCLLRLLLGFTLLRSPVLIRTARREFRVVTAYFFLNRAKKFRNVNKKQVSVTFEFILCSDNDKIQLETSLRLNFQRKLVHRITTKKNIDAGIILLWKKAVK